MAIINFDTMILPYVKLKDEMVYSCPYNQQFRKGETITLVEYNPLSYLLYIYTDNCFQGPIKDNSVIRSNNSVIKKWARSKYGSSNMLYVINLNTVTFKNNEPIEFSSPLLTVEDGQKKVTFSVLFSISYHAIIGQGNVILEKFVNNGFNSLNSYINNIISNIIKDRIDRYREMRFEDTSSINSYKMLLQSCECTINTDKIKALRKRILEDLAVSEELSELIKINQDSFTISIVCNDYETIQNKANERAEKISVTDKQIFDATQEGRLTLAEQGLAHDQEMDAISKKIEEDRARQVGQLEVDDIEFERKLTQRKQLIEVDTWEQSQKLKIETQQQLIAIYLEAVKFISQQYQETVNRMFEFLNTYAEANRGLGVDEARELLKMVGQLLEYSKSVERIPTLTAEKLNEMNSAGFFSDSSISSSFSALNISAFLANFNNLAFSTGSESINPNLPDIKQ